MCPLTRWREPTAAQCTGQGRGRSPTTRPGHQALGLPSGISSRTRVASTISTGGEGGGLEEVELLWAEAGERGLDGAKIASDHDRVPRSVGW